MYHSGANISSNEGASPSSLFATGRRQSAGLPNERSTFLMHQYHLKKSNSLKTGNLLQPNDNRSRLHDEIEVSDEITDDDDDTVSSGLSGEYYSFNTTFDIQSFTIYHASYQMNCFL